MANISPALTEILKQSIEQDSNFFEKKEQLKMMYIEELLLGKPDKILLMKLYYHVQHSASPLKQRCLDLFNLHFKKIKTKPKKVNMELIKREIQLNAQIAAEQRKELLENHSPSSIENDNSEITEEKPKSKSEQLLKEDELDLVELEKLKSELEEQVLLQMRGMGNDLKESQLRFNQILQKDSTTIFDTQFLMTANTASLTEEQLKLKKVHSDTWRTTCYMLLMFIFVIVIFMITYIAISKFPNSNKPKVTTIISSTIEYAWNSIFDEALPKNQSLPNTNQEEL
eukprot:NODE_219_length_12440_cov_2.445588.p5 type:complete len:284 gc:universal NODE_219_length_12440_cov_2.445588:1861-1010(-)